MGNKHSLWTQHSPQDTIEVDQLKHALQAWGEVIGQHDQLLQQVL